MGFSGSHTNGAATAETRGKVKDSMALDGNGLIVRNEARMG